MRLCLLLTPVLFLTACAPYPGSVETPRDPEGSSTPAVEEPHGEPDHDFPFVADELDEQQAHTYEFMSLAWDMPDGDAAQQAVCETVEGSGANAAAEEFAEGHAQTDFATEYTFDTEIAATMLETFCADL